MRNQDMDVGELEVARRRSRRVRVSWLNGRQVISLPKDFALPGCEFRVVRWFGLVVLIPAGGDPAAAVVAPSPNPPENGAQASRSQADAVPTPAAATQDDADARSPRPRLQLVSVSSAPVGRTGAEYDRSAAQAVPSVRDLRTAAVVDELRRLCLAA